MAEKKAVKDTEFEDALISEFPCGYEDEDGNIHKEFEYREMTGADEEAISGNNVKSSGAKMINTILDRCIVRIGTFVRKDMSTSKWSDIIKSLTVHDQDFALIAIRKESIGSTIVVKHTCPSCKTEITTELDVDELEVRQFEGERVMDFELKKGYKDKDGEIHKVGKIRLPNGLDRELLEPIARNNLGSANTLLLTRIIVELGSIGKVNDAIVRNLTTGDRDYLIKLISENNFGYQFETTVECPNCGNSFEGELSAVNFL